MAYKSTIIIEQEGKWFVARSLELGVVSQGRTVEEVVSEAEQFEEAGELANALERWNAASNLGGDPIIFCRLGRVATKLGKWEEAETALRLPM